MYEIFLVESGEVTFIVDNKEYKFTEGDTITVEPNEDHEVRNEGTKTMVMTYFSVLK